MEEELSEQWRQRCKSPLTGGGARRAGEAGTDCKVQARNVRGRAAALRGPFGSRDSAVWGHPVIRPQGKPVKRRFLPSGVLAPREFDRLAQGPSAYRTVEGAF